MKGSSAVLGAMLPQMKGAPAHTALTCTDSKLPRGLKDKEEEAELSSSAAMNQVKQWQSALHAAWLP